MAPAEQTETGKRKGEKKDGKTMAGNESAEH